MGEQGSVATLMDPCDKLTQKEDRRSLNYVGSLT